MKRSFLPAICLLGLFSASCVKRAEPPAPEPPATEAIDRALAQTQEDLEKLRMSRAASEDLLQKAQTSLEKARAFSKAGQGEKAYEQVLMAQKQLQAAKAASAMAGSKESPAETSKKIESLKQKAAEPVQDLGVKISRAEAERAIGEVARRLDKAREEQKELDTQVARVEDMLAGAKEALSQGAFDRAYNAARKAGNYLEEVLKAVGTSHAKGSSGELMETWLVKQGDNLWDIAEDPRVYGDPLLWPYLFKANSDRIKNPNLILVGWKLKIPRGRVSRKGLKNLDGAAGGQGEGAPKEEVESVPDLALPEGEVLLETEPIKATPMPPTPVPAAPVAPTPVPPTPVAVATQAATPLPAVPTLTATALAPTFTATATLTRVSAKVVATPVPTVPPAKAAAAPPDDLDALLNGLETPGQATPAPTAVPPAPSPVSTPLAKASPAATPVPTLILPPAPVKPAGDASLDDLLKQLDLPPVPEGNGDTGNAGLELPEL